MPKRHVGSNPNSASGAVDAESIGVCQGAAGAEMTLDQWRVFEEAVGHQAQLATFYQVASRLAQQVLAGLVVGMHTMMERRVADDGAESLGCRFDARAGDQVG